MAVKAGVKALQSGIKNTQTQLILKAGKFETLNEAISKAAENDTNIQHNYDNALAMQRRFNTNIRGRERGTRNYPSNNRFSQENGYSRYYNQQYRGNANRGRNNWSSRGNFNSSGGRGRHRSPPQYVYVAQQENIGNNVQQMQHHQQHQQQQPNSIRVIWRAFM